MFHVLYCSVLLLQFPRPSEYYKAIAQKEINITIQLPVAYWNYKSPRWDRDFSEASSFRINVYKTELTTMDNESCIFAKVTGVHQASNEKKVLGDLSSSYANRKRSEDRALALTLLYDEHCQTRFRIATKAYFVFEAKKSISRLSSRFDWPKRQMMKQIAVPTSSNPETRYAVTRYTVTISSESFTISV